MTNLKFKKLDDKATLPTRGSTLAAGLDLYSIEEVIVKNKTRCSVRTGLAVSVPQGFYGRIAPRSGLALKNGIDVLAGVIDSDYRGEVICLLINFGDDDFTVKSGDRIAQLIIECIEILEPTWEENLDQTQRETGGFGSSGK